MAMNLLNPIQLLRGSSGAIAATSGEEGTLYYDSSRGTLCIRRKDGGLYDLVRSWTAKVTIILYPGDYTVAIPRWPTCDIKSKYSDNKANVSINSLVCYAAYPKLYDLNMHLLGHVDTRACYIRVENCNVYILITMKAEVAY